MSLYSQIIILKDCVNKMKFIQAKIQYSNKISNILFFLENFKFILLHI